MRPSRYAGGKEDRILALIVVLLILVGTIEFWTCGITGPKMALHVK